MSKLFAIVTVLLGAGSSCLAADLLITNAKLIDGVGGNHADTGVLVSDGLIAEVGSDIEAPAGATVIDAGGMTLMPGLINTHWHLFAGSAAGNESALDAYVEQAVIPTLDAVLERGVTTIMSPGDHFPRILDIRQSLQDGELRGPRLLAVGPVFTSPNDWPTQICGTDEECNSRLNAVVDSEEAARAKVRLLAEAGVDAVKLVYDDRIAPDARIEDEIVAAIADEAHRHDLRLFVHHSAPDVPAKVLLDLGVDAFVHVPADLTGALSDMRERRIPVCSTVSTFLATSERPMSRETGFEPNPVIQAVLENIRILNSEGIPVAFGTDSVAGPRGLPTGFFPSTTSGEGQFLAELYLLNRVLSNADVIASVTINAAKYLGLEDEIGSVEMGKVADLVLIDGDPLANIGDLEKVRLVVQAGVVVVDRR